MDVAFTRGGQQEARGGGGNTFYVENAPELLDALGEWYYDVDTRLLSFAGNGTGDAPDGAATLVATQLAALVRLTGSAAAPVAGVTLSGLTFAHTAVDYMLPYVVPSGGDWSTADNGAVRLSGTEGAVVDGCTFDAPGGIAVMISGYNRAARVTRNEFKWTGSSAIVSIGLGGGSLDGGAPDFPEGTLIEGNLAREISVLVKQSGFYYAGMSANATLRGNVGFNAARALVNINDGAFGGHLMTKNLLFNAVCDCGARSAWGGAARTHPVLPSRLPRPSSRETHDHGPVNSVSRSARRHC